MANARAKLSERLAGKEEFSLSKLRLSKGLSQVKLAEKMGVSQPQIAKLERGEDDVKFSTIERLAMALGVDDASVLNAVKASMKRNKGK